MIIWGWRSSVRRLRSGRVPCPACGERALMQLLQRRRWFTLFFIPVIPLSSSTWATHACCGAGGKLTREQVEAFMAPIRAAA